MIPIKRKSFINRYRNCVDVFVFSLWQLTIQFPKVYYRITVDSVSVQRRIIPLQSNRVLRYVPTRTRVVIPEPVVVHPYFGILVLPLVAKRTIIQRTRIAKLHFFLSKRSFFSCSTFSFDVSISYSFSYNFCEIV